MMEIAFLSFVLGIPLAICAIAVIGSHFHEGDNASLIDWQPTRSAEAEARMKRSEVDQMLAAVNRYRRARGAGERSLQEITSERSFGSRKEHGSA
jgi:hypothetical protein